LWSRTLNTAVESGVFFILRGREDLHNIHGLGEKSTYKGQREDTNTSDNLVQPKKCNYGNEKKKPVEPSTFFRIFHAGQFVAQIYFK